MYSDAVKVVGAGFEVAELTTLVEQALERGTAIARRPAEPDQPTSSVSSSTTSNRSATAP